VKHSLDRFKSLSLFVKEHLNSLVYVRKLKLVVKKKACHCNKIFLRKTKLILALNHFIPRCAYYNPYFAFRRTGTHPPFFS
jgi:hypothetical protein